MSYFKVLQEINKGAFGTLYLATDKLSETQKFAIKTIQTQKEKKIEKKIIKKEIEIWEKLEASIQKPKGIPKFYRWFKEEISTSTRTNVEFHLVFDYFPYSLKSLLSKLKKTQETLPLDKLLIFSRTLLNTLAYLQTMKICHRDIKPDNILLNSEWDRVYVIDFGESKELQSLATTIMTNIRGTKKYLSPELYYLYKNEIGNEETLNKINLFKSDVFSLGLVLMELGVLDLPKRSNDLDEFKKSIKNNIKNIEKKYSALCQDLKNKELLRKYKNLLKDCLEINPEERLDFINLFSKFSEKWEEGNGEKLRKRIILNEEGDFLI